MRANNLILLTKNRNAHFVLNVVTYHIVTCMMVHVTNKMNSRSDDWIYYHFSYICTLNYNYIPAIQRYR
jgi:hypothetical protein